jgi:hypothetical protein
MLVYREVLARHQQRKASCASAGHRQAWQADGARLSQRPLRTET